MYLADTNANIRTIWAFDYDPESGNPTNRRVFVDTHGMAGRPDGGAVDAEGCYWMAGIGGGELVRFTPNGAVDRVIPVPCKTPTKVAFGGAGLDTLFVTSLKRDGGDLDPMAGCLFAITATGVTGIEIPLFAG
jgi:sugar lactone lactonase YvrE